MARPCCTQVYSQKQSDGAAAIASGDQNNADSEEFHSSDPARTTAEFLSGLWALIARGNTMVRGVRYRSEGFSRSHEFSFLTALAF